MVRTGRKPSAATGPLRLRAALLRSLLAVEREIDTALARATLSPNDVHDVHRELRRLASGLAVWGHLVSQPQQEGVREVSRRIRRLARLVGRVRDHDVTASLLLPAGRGMPNHRLTSWDKFLGRFREDTDTGRELLRAFLRTERQGGLFDRTRGFLDLSPRADASRGLHRILAEERRRRQGRVRKAHRKARREPNTERMHRLRVRIRQWRHFSSLELAARATVHHPPPPSWQRLQDRLGRLHDLDVALATVPEELAAESPARRLRDRRRELRRSVRTSLERIAARPDRATAWARGSGDR